MDLNLHLSIRLYGVVLNKQKDNFALLYTVLYWLVLLLSVGQSLGCET